MSVLHPVIVLTMNLRNQIASDSPVYMSKRVAHAELVKYTGHDFGDDAQRWVDWFVERGLLSNAHLQSDEVKPTC